MKRTIILAIAFALAADLVALSEAAEPRKSQGMPAPAQAMRGMPSVSMLSGTITRINNADPKNVTLEVKNDSDGKTTTLSVMPWTRIVKNAEISELKTGDKVRVAARKAEDNKETAISVIFGKVEWARPPREKP